MKSPLLVPLFGLALAAACSSSTEVRTQPSAGSGGTSGASGGGAGRGGTATGGTTQGGSAGKAGSSNGGTSARGGAGGNGGGGGSQPLGGTAGSGGTGAAGEGGMAGEGMAGGAGGPGCPAQEPPPDSTVPNCDTSQVVLTCTYPSSSGCNGYACRCLSDHMGGVDCWWTSLGPQDCADGGA